MVHSLHGAIQVFFPRWIDFVGPFVLLLKVHIPPASFQKWAFSKNQIRFQWMFSPKNHCHKITFMDYEL